ncbi:MAG TPA: PPC domain-containing DNA-binding protein [Burkholderiales bacterium]|nr:PPC domain-containing DNA-binding protein [Burkholderiales bacterium]
MRSKVLNEAGERSFALIFDTGDEPVSLLERFAREHNLTAARFTAIGAFREVVVGYFDWEKKDYLRIPIREQVEVLSLVGDVAIGDKGPKIHAHVVLGKRDGSAHGGHLLEAKVRPTLEVVLTESPAVLVREHDAASGLALIRV